MDSSTIKFLIAVSGAAASFLFGGWTQLLSILLTFVIIDYATGIAASGKEGNLKSTIGYWGIAKKITIFGLVAVAHLIDTAVGDAHLFRDTTIFFFMTNEVLSLIENAGRLGVPIPPILTKAVQALKEKAAGDNNENGI